MNESKISDPRMWKKWKQSGALGTYESSFLGRNGITIKAIGKLHAGSGAGNSTLSLGSKIINEGVLSDGHKWSISAPIIAVVAPGHNYKLGEILRRLPEGTQSIKSVFGVDSYKPRVLKKSSRIK